MLDVIPAVDILGGRCVRLTQGDYRRQTVYHDDPVEMARRWESQGARWLHLVDLDGARTGRMKNLRPMLSVLRQARCRVEVGGGIRDERTARRLLDAGARRVIMGTAAFTRLQAFNRILAKLGTSLWLSVDTRGDRVMLQGWTSSSGATLADLLVRARDWPIGGIVFTSILRDGSMRGPDLRSARRALHHYPGPVILSGGIATLAHIRAIRKIRAENVRGLIIGKALYEGKFSLQEAMKAGV